MDVFKLTDIFSTKNKENENKINIIDDSNKGNLSFLISKISDNYRPIRNVAISFDSSMNRTKIDIDQSNEMINSFNTPYRASMTN